MEAVEQNVAVCRVLGPEWQVEHSPDGALWRVVRAGVPQPPFTCSRANLYLLRLELRRRSVEGLFMELLAPPEGRTPRAPTNYLLANPREQVEAALRALGLWTGPEPPTCAPRFPWRTRSARAERRAARRPRQRVRAGQYYAEQQRRVRRGVQPGNGGEFWRNEAWALLRLALSVATGRVRQSEAGFESMAGLKERLGYVRTIGRNCRARQRGEV